MSFRQAPRQGAKEKQSLHTLAAASCVMYGTTIHRSPPSFRAVGASTTACSSVSCPHSML